MAMIIDGRRIAEEMKRELKERLPERGLCLVSVLTADSPATQVYLRQKRRHARDVGIEFRVVDLTGSSPEDVLRTIEGLNRDADVTGITLEFPLGPGIPRSAAFSILPVKDAEGIHPVNLGKLVLGEEGIPPATPSAVVEILTRAGISLRGAEVAVVSHSPIVGKPLSLMLLNRDATVHVVHEFTGDIKSITSRCDVVVTAAGVPGLITREHVKRGAVVVDVAMNVAEKGLCGDADFDALVDWAGAITPVPGGVGPVTNAAVLGNLLACHRLQCSSRGQP